MYPASLSLSSSAAKQIGTSGWSYWSLLIPYGLPTRPAYLIYWAPLSLRDLLAAEADPPVARIGSTTITSPVLISDGNLA